MKKSLYDAYVAGEVPDSSLAIDRTLEVFGGGTPPQIPWKERPDSIHDIPDPDGDLIRWFCFKNRLIPIRLGAVEYKKGKLFGIEAVYRDCFVRHVYYSEDKSEVLNEQLSFEKNPAIAPKFWHDPVARRIGEHMDRFERGAASGK